MDITDARELWLTFKCSCTMLGFDPIYNVRIMHKEEILTMVEETLGYIYRRIYFKVKDSPHKGNGNLHGNNQYHEITECVDM